MKNCLGESIIFARKRAGLSAAALSRQVGFSSSYVTKLEHGNIIPSIEAFSVIVVALDLSDAEILFVIKSLGTKVGKES